MASVATSLVQVKETEEGVYTVEQVESVSTLPKVVNDGDRYEIDIPVAGALAKVTGYVVPSTLEAGLEATILGQKIGPFYGSLTKGLGISVNLFLVSGGIHLNHEGKQVVLKVNLGGKWWPGDDVNFRQELFTL